MVAEVELNLIHVSTVNFPLPNSQSFDAPKYAAPLGVSAIFQWPDDAPNLNWLVSIKVLPLLDAVPCAAGLRSFHPGAPVEPLTPSYPISRTTLPKYGSQAGQAIRGNTAVGTVKPLSLAYSAM